jgi:arylformamidase
MTYRGMDQAALDAAYNIGAHTGIERRDRYLADWAERSRALSARVKAKRDLRYGPGARQRLDFFPCGTKAAPTLVFIHGGYWQMTEKETYGCIAAGPMAHGINVAMVEYTLAPAARITAMVAEVKRALLFLRRNVGGLGGSQKIALSGHSAGAHLAAMMIGEPAISGILAVSGIYELEPIRLSYLNEKLALDEDEAARMSPLQHIPASAPPMVVTVGGKELPEFKRQAADYQKALAAKGLRGELTELTEHDHFSILEELAAPEGKLTEMVRRFFR